MDEVTTQHLWTQLHTDLFCGDCKAVRVLIWEKERQVTPPREAVVHEDCWYCVHCDYFKRRVEQPDRLQRCEAHQKKAETQKESENK